MCLVKPLKIVALQKGKAILENGVRAVYDKASGDLAVGDIVIVYGNYIIQKVSYEPEQSSA